MPEVTSPEEALPAACAAYPVRLDQGTTAALAAALAAARGAGTRRVLLFPVGSVEPHGPHLPLATDTLLATETALRAAADLRAQGVFAAVAPALPYGVTDFAAGFAGALTVPAAALVALVVAVAEAGLRDGFEHIAIINHHLEPGQLAALETARATLASGHGAGAVSLPSVVSRRWGKHLGAEFRSGACHAGRYETALVLAATSEGSGPAAARVDLACAATLPALAVSLSAAIAAGTTTFKAAGMDRAYTGAPAEATAAEGAQLYAAHTVMVVTEVLEALATLNPTEQIPPMTAPTGASHD